MINLPKLTDLEISGKKVLVRADLDLGDKIEPGDEIKLQSIIPTLSYLLEKQSKLIVIGHRGRPDQETREKLSLREVSQMLSKILEKNVSFVDESVGEKVREQINMLQNGEILMLENLRFDGREEKNDEGFAKELADFGDVYVNEAFSAGHRNHASVVGVPKFLPHAAGLRFYQEIENLSQILDATKRPVIMVISGLKEDKLTYIESFLKFADKILVGGRLPDLLENKKLQVASNKLLVAKLLPDKEDITIHSIEMFEEEIKKAKTIVVSGPIGKFEEAGHRQGTERVLKAVAANNEAFKVAGGGDTEAAIATLSLSSGFNWISVGGGAMLEFLANGTLPGIEALPF